MNKRQFGLTVVAYLTGWLIARATFERVWHHFMTNSENAARQKYIADQSKAFVDELIGRGIPVVREERERVRAETRERGVYDHEVHGM
jgi:hypothetical protein